jgi:hypothetical protein
MPSKHAKLEKLSEPMTLEKEDRSFVCGSGILPRLSRLDLLAEASAQAGATPTEAIKHLAHGTAKSA